MVQCLTIALLVGRAAHGNKKRRPNGFSLCAKHDCRFALDSGPDFAADSRRAEHCLRSRSERRAIGIAPPDSPASRRSLADDAWRSGGPRLGRGRRGLRHRRCVRRPSQLRHGPARPAAGKRGLSRRDPQSAGLAFVRCLAHFWTTAPVFRHQCGKHGLDDQPLHGQSQGAQRRRLQPGRSDRSATRSRDLGLLPTRPRSLQGRAGHHRQRRGQPAALGALRLLERQGPAFDPA